MSKEYTQEELEEATALSALIRFSQEDEVIVLPSTSSEMKERLRRRKETLKSTKENQNV